MRRRFTTLKEKDESEYLIFTTSEHGFSFIPPRDVEYRIGINGEWKFLSGGTRSDYADDGSEIFVRSEFISAELVKPPFGTFILDGTCNLSGSPMALLNKRYSIENAASVFKEMFKNCKGVREVSANFLPSTILSINCYNSMFYGCTSLTTAPELPATTLAVNCYNSMFYGCTSLTTAPELPATTLEDYCYNSMFYGCSNLSYIKALFLTLPYSGGNDGYPTTDWLDGVASTGTFVKSKDATWDVVGNSGVPSGWTVITDDQEGGSEVSFIISEGLQPAVDVEYKCIEGMTWGEWVNSEYNTSGYIIYYDRVFEKDGIFNVEDAGESVTSQQTIIPNREYSCV